MFKEEGYKTDLHKFKSNVNVEEKITVFMDVFQGIKSKYISEKILQE